MPDREVNAETRVSDEQEAAVRRAAAEALFDSWLVDTRGFADTSAQVALDASGVWKRIEELERELAEVQKANALNVAAHMAAAKEARTLRAECARLREALDPDSPSLAEAYGTLSDAFAELGEECDALRTDNERLRELNEGLESEYVEQVRSAELLWETVKRRDAENERLREALEAGATMRLDTEFGPSRWQRRARAALAETQENAEC